MDPKDQEALIAALTGAAITCAKAAQSGDSEIEKALAEALLRAMETTRRAVPATRESLAKIGIHVREDATKPVLLDEPSRVRPGEYATGQYVPVDKPVPPGLNGIFRVPADGGPAR